MTRYRWWRAEWPAPIRTLSKRMRQHSFSEREACGFILDRVREDYLEARFVERYEFKETVTDPFGKEVIFDRLEFRQTSFRASRAWPGLELVDTSRSPQSLVNRLLELTNFTLPISPVVVEVVNWADGFQHIFGGAVRIDAIQIGSLQIEDGIKAKVVIKGEKDVRAACNDVIQGRKHVLEKLQLQVARDQHRASVLLANNASAKVQGYELRDDVVLALRSSLPNSV